MEFLCPVSTALLKQNYMMQNTLLLLLVGQQQGARLSLLPSVTSVLAWGHPLLGQPCADPFSSTPWDQAGREWGVSLLFMRKQS